MNIKRTYGRLLALGLAGMAGSAFAQTAPAVTGQCDNRLDQALTEHARRFVTTSQAEHLIGSSLQVRLGGKICSHSNHGLADLETKRAVNDDTIYHWASNTKMLLAVGVMQLRDRGLLKLDDPVSMYLPEAMKIHNPFGGHDQITLRHLLTHSAGLRGATFPWRGDNDWAPHEPTEWSQIAAMMPYTQVEWAPGTRASYSNLGTSMLGRVIEVITGDDIEVYLTKNVLMPLGMSRSYFDHTPYHLLKDRSNNYTIQKGVTTADGLDFDTGATVANGGLNAPFADIARWTDFLLGVNDNGNYDTVLSRATLHDMWEPKQRILGGGNEDWGMGYVFFSRDTSPERAVPGVNVVGHTGGQKAFTTFVYVVPKHGLAMIYGDNTTDLDRPDHRKALVSARDNGLDLLLPVLEKIHAEK